MRKPKPIVTNTVIGVITSSIIASSCLTNYNLDDNRYGELTENATLGNHLIDVAEAGLSDAVLQRSRLIATIVEDMFNNRSLAHQFAQNPNEFLRTRGYSSIDANIMLTENERTFLLALSDDDIMNAAIIGDVCSFIHLAHEKGYLRMIKKNGSSITEFKSLFKNENEYNQFINQIKNNPNYELLSEEEAWVWAAAAVVYIVVGGIQYVVVETVAAVQLAILYHAAAYVEGPGIDYDTENLEPALRLYMNVDNNYLLYDDLHRELITNQTETITNMLSNYSKKQLTTEEMETAKRVISTNLEHYYGFRK